MQVGALGEVNFPVSRLKTLEKFSLSLDSEEDSDEFPVEFAREIGASQSIRWLDVPAAPALLSEVAKMTGLWSLRLGLTEEENVLPRLLPLKNTLRELDFWAPLESRTGEMLCEFTRLQSLRVWGTGSMQEKIDDFLSAIRPLPLRCLHLQFGNIGEEGVDTLKGWDTLMEVQLPNGFPSERLAELERIERTVPLPGKDGRTRDVRRKVFFSNEKYMRTLNRPTCLDAHGEYIHWANPYSGVWMLGR